MPPPISASILGATVVFAGWRDGRWSILARVRVGAELRLLPHDGDTLDEMADTHRRARCRSRRGRRAVDARADCPPRRTRAILLIEGDWSGSTHALAEAARALCAPDGSSTSLGDVGLAAYELARDLAAVTGLREVCELAVRAVVKTLPCRVATFAVPTDQGNLSIVATHGYPVALTEHLRISPGAGIIGAVYQKGVPLRVDDVTTLPGFERRRSRYRTKSFAALPVTAGSDVLGVLCVTDRDGDVALSVDDVADLGILLAPVALALVRERTQRQAQFFAQAAIVDPSSGLFNRPYFQSRLQEELQRSTRQNTPVSLLMLDIDSFKSINDTFGHLAGDTVIKDVADILQELGARVRRVRALRRRGVRGGDAGQQSRQRDRDCRAHPAAHSQLPLHRSRAVRPARDGQHRCRRIGTARQRARSDRARRQRALRGQAGRKEPRQHQPRHTRARPPPAPRVTATDITFSTSSENDGGWLPVAQNGRCLVDRRAMASSAARRTPTHRLPGTSESTRPVRRGARRAPAPPSAERRPPPAALRGRRRADPAQSERSLRQRALLLRPLHRSPRVVPASRNCVQSVEGISHQRVSLDPRGPGDQPEL